MSELPLYQRAFGPHFQMPSVICEAIASGELLDISWHNDVAPSFQHRDAADDAQDYDLRLWVHEEDPALREPEGVLRFSVYEHHDQTRSSSRPTT